MSPVLIVTFGIFLFFVFSQFGKGIAARKSFAWWIISVALLWALVYPSSLQHIAHLFGVTLVSNLVIAGMLLFLMLQIIMEEVETTLQLRKIRALVSTLAYREFVAAAEASKTKKLLIISPCYNEEENLPMHIANLQKTGFDFCIIDDGSQDNSRLILKSTAPKNFVSHPTNIGVAGVLMTGFKIAAEMGFEYVAQCDSDGQHPHHEIARLLEAAQQKKLDLLVASRFLEKNAASLVSTTSSRRIGGMILQFALKILARKANFTDPTSGLRIYSRKAYLCLLKQMPDEYPEPESIAILAHGGMAMGELQVQMEPRKFGTSSLGAGKSALYMIKVLTGIIALRIRHLK